jgi:hypothetical protein
LTQKAVDSPLFGIVNYPMLASLQRFSMLYYALAAAALTAQAFTAGDEISIINEQGNLHFATSNASGQIIINGKPLETLFEEFLAEKLSNASTACLLGCNADNFSAACPAGTFLNATARTAVCLPCPVGAVSHPVLASQAAHNLVSMC